MSRKQRSKSLIERFGFNDSDLKKPLHDQIMKWLYRDIQTVIRDIATDIGTIKSLSTTWDSESIDVLRLDADRYVEQQIERLQQKLEWQDRRIEAHQKRDDDTHGWVDDDISSVRAKRKEIADTIEKFQSWEGLGEPPANPIIKINLPRWEPTIMAKNNYAVGFTDMEVVAEIPALTVWGLSDHRHDDDDLSLPTWGITSQKTIHFCFEVKSEIQNLGELFRQINLYKEYRRGAVFVVVCPDDSEKDLLREQGVILYKCPPFAKQQGQGSLFE